MKRHIISAWTALSATLVFLHSSICLASGHGHDMSINWFSGLFSVFATDSDKPPPLIGNIINFLILLWLLYIIIFKPMARHLKERREQIENDLDEARKLSEEASGLYQTAQERVLALDQAIAQIHKEVYSSAEKEKERLHNEAEKQAERIMNHAKEEMAQSRTNTIQEMRSSILTESVSRAREILAGRITPQDHFRMTQKAIEEIEKRAGA